MVRKRFSLFGVVVLALSLLFPSNAFAVDFMPKGVFYQTELDGGNYGAVVAAYNQYDAACYVLGKNPDSISAAIKTKLSDPDYGGRFYDYAQSFFTQSGALEDVPGWVPTYIVWGSELADLVLTDYQSVWYSTSTMALHDDALTDLLRVLSGEDLGGGSGGSIVPVGDRYPITLYAQDSDKTSGFNVRTAVIASLVDGNLVLGSGTTNYSPDLNSSYYVSSGVMYLSSSFISLANSLIEEGYEVCFLSSFGNAILVYGHGLSVRRTSVPGGTTSKALFGSGMSAYVFAGITAYYDVGSGLFNLVPDGEPYTQSVSNPRYNDYFSQVFDEPFLTPPSGDWPQPENPVTPTPPEQPTPTAPTVTPDNDPTEPVVTWPTSPTVVIPTQPTPSTTPSGLDYTGLLTLINDNLISIDDYLQALNSSFNSFRSDFLTAVDSIVDSIRNIYSYLGHLNDILEVHCKHIRDQIEDSVYDLELYLMELFEWLPRQLNFDAQFTYDDTYVTMLLRRILNKIPGGNGVPTTYMPNPQADEPGFFDWLLDLWHRFLIDLVSVLPDSLGGLVDTFSQLTHYFPFSIPWDVFALLSLFAHDPVTPVFDIPWGYGGGDGEVQLIHIDLSVWNDMMATVRPVLLVGFCIRLALVTKEMLSNFDINKGGV